MIDPTEYLKEILDKEKPKSMLELYAMAYGHYLAAVAAMTLIHRMAQEKYWPNKEQEKGEKQ